MRSDDIALYEEVKRAHQAIYKMTELIRRRFEASNSGMHEAAETSLVLREAMSLAEDTVKSLRARREEFTKLTCILWVKEGDGVPIKTPFVYAAPVVKMMASVPHKKRSPREYEALMDHFRIPSALRNVGPENLDAVSPNFNGMVEYITQCLENGDPLPPGIDPKKTYPKYTFAPMRKRRDLEDFNPLS